MIHFPFHDLYHIQPDDKHPNSSVQIVNEPPLDGVHSLRIAEASSRQHDTPYGVTPLEWQCYAVANWEFSATKIGHSMFDEHDCEHYPSTSVVGSSLSLFQCIS